MDIEVYRMRGMGWEVDGKRGMEERGEVDGRWMEGGWEVDGKWMEGGWKERDGRERGWKREGMRDGKFLYK
jgi:ATP-dependent RNA helicase RhlE